ncbi:hypothetical protein CDAR_280071 [Caerostris darwini]|uniref:Uncharacterized protein n=1 Tax=Caerostris darwini TaxID=1538125 RepID=A0AAV4S6Z9_9ARAC|nr:hypothetical protein CDAR_280071 [Caerostris darwini]
MDIPRGHFCNFLSNQRNKSKAVLHNVSSPHNYNPSPELWIPSHLPNASDIRIRRLLKKCPISVRDSRESAQLGDVSGEDWDGVHSRDVWVLDLQKEEMLLLREII